MRRAQHADAAMVLEWRNDPYVRSVSRNDMPIELDAHLAWFGRILGSPDHLLLIAEKNGISVGVVRFDRLDDLKYEISLFLNPLLAGRRQGLLMMQAAQQMLSEQVGQDIVIAAETLPRNHASQRLFQKAGYRQFGCHFELRLPCEPRLSRRDGPARE
jgi:RimJ/RimL family protein N-acetyltransferase